MFIWNEATKFLLFKRIFLSFVLQLIQFDVDVEVKAKWAKNNSSFGKGFE
jgi:hypothetical protein